MRTREEIQNDIIRLTRRSLWIGIALGLLLGFVAGLVVGLNQGDTTHVVVLGEGQDV
ncbi:MAG: hypothetical protein AAGA91_17285 [Pseudomonadota bacterium]